MVLLLSDDIVAHQFFLRHTQRESAVAFLPLETGEFDLFVHPMRGVGFQIPYKSGEAMGGAQTDQQMDVVSDAAHHFSDAAEISSEPTKVGVKAVPQYNSDDRNAVFGAEDDVVMQGYVGRGHRCGLGVLSPLPGLCAF